MSDDLPIDVKDAIHSGRKIEAIKRLREHRGLGLKEAKEAVDAYAADHQHLIVAPQSDGSGRLIVVIIVAAIGFGIYSWLTQ